jgi:hypothetical protein
MKLFTEEQMHSVILLALGRHGIYIPNKHYQDLIDLLTSIELPSDEEISAESMDLFGKNSTSINDILQYKAFKRGANWMRDKITGLTNEHIKAIKER